MAQATDFSTPGDMAQNGWFEPITVESTSSSMGPEEGQSEAEWMSEQAAIYSGDLSIFKQQAIRNKAAADLKSDVRKIGISRRADGTWIVYQKDVTSYDNQVFSSRGAADSQIAKWMSEEGISGANKWEAYKSTQPGEADYWRTREKADYADRVDPDKPIQQEIPLGNGQSLFILSNGKMITAESDLDWTGWDEASNTHTIGNKEMVELPNGDVVEKSVDTKKGDVKIVETIPLDDGSRVAIFNDGSRQLIAGGKVSSVEIDSETGYVVSRDSKGNPTLRKPLYEPGIDYTAAGFNILTGPEGPISDLGLPETPSTIETIGGQQFIRGTRGELEGLDGALDRAIDYAIISGQPEKARAWDDFRKRPDSLTVLEKAMEWARTPGDQQMISKLHYMTSAEAAAAGEGALGLGAGRFGEVAEPPQFAQDAYKAFQDSITGGSMPTAEDFQAALAMEDEPPAPTVREQLAIDLDQAKLDAALAKTEREEEIHEAAMISDKAESEARIRKLLREEEQAGIAFENDQARRKAESDFKLGQTVTPTTTTTGSETTTTTTPTTTTTVEETAEEKAKRIEEEEKAEAERRRMEEKNKEAAKTGGPRWVYSTRSGKYVYAQGGFDILAQGEGLYLESSDPNAPAINLYDVSEGGTGELLEVASKTVVDTAAVGGAESYILYSKDGAEVRVVRGSAAEARLLGDEQGRWSEVKPVAEEVIEPDVVEETGGVTFDDVPLSEDETPFSQAITGTGVSADQLADAVAAQNVAGADPAGMAALSQEDDAPLPIATAASSIERNPEPQADIGNIGTQTYIPTSSGIHQAAADVPSSRDYASIPGPTGAEVASAIGGGVKDIFTTNPARDDPYAHVKAVGRAVAYPWSTAIKEVFNQEDAEESPAYEMEQYDPDWMASGGKTRDRMAMVGESGPELALFPNGTEIIPLDRNVKPDQRKRLRRRGIRGMQAGGLVFDPSPGISQFLGGREVGPSQGRLFRKAGFTTPSAQALRNILPEELEEFRRMGAEARIPEGTFERELGQGIASGTRRSNSARFLPLSLRS